MDKYEKLYNEALERAKKIHNEILDNEILGFPDQIREIFPELRGLEDERIRKWLVDYFSSIKKTVWIYRDITCEQILEWLEKQKENPKNAISIPADCATNAKCEDRWHKTANSLPDNGRDVLAKDALGNYLIASFDGAQWFVSVYDGQDHPVLHTPPILEWCDIETCEESLHISETCKENADSFTDEQKPAEWSEVELEFRGEKVTVKRPFYRDDKGRGYSTTKQDEEVAWNALRAWCEKKGISLYDLYPKAEWSEEDADILNCCISSIEEAKENRYAYKETDGDTSYDREIAFLKSLRPSWKPSEEQLNALNIAITYFMHETNYKNPTELRELYDDLLKLK